MSYTSNQYKSFFLVAAIYRFLARMLSLIFSIKRGKDRVRVLIYSNDGKFYLLKVDLVASSGLYLEVVSGAMKVMKKLQLGRF